MIRLPRFLVYTLFLCLLPFSSAHAQLRLILSTDKSSFQLVEPLVVNVELKNESSRPMKVVKYLAPDYQFTTYEVTKPGGEQIPYRSLTILNVRQDLYTTLGPGESLFKRAKIFFGNKGWVFDEPGTYKATATHTALEGNHIRSNELALEIKSPPDEAHRRATELMLTGQAGIFLLWEGGDQFSEGISNLEKVVRQLSETVHATYANYALGANLSQDQGERKADLEKATTYLERARMLSEDKIPTDYLRSRILLQLSDIYGKTGERKKQEEIRRMFRREFQKKKQFQKEMRVIEENSSR